MSLIGCLFNTKEMHSLDHKVSNDMDVYRGENPISPPTPLHLPILVLLSVTQREAWYFMSLSAYTHITYFPMEYICVLYFNDNVTLYIPFCILHFKN